MEHLTVAGQEESLMACMQNLAVSVMFEPHFLDCTFGVLYIDLNIYFIAPVLLWEAAGEEQVAYK